MGEQNKSVITPSPIRAAVVDSDEEGLRLDRWFKRRYPELSHGALQKMLRTGQIRVDGKRADSADRLQAGQSLRLPPQLSNEARVSESRGARPMRRGGRLRDLILYEDDDVIALNKPAGLAVQGGTGLKENLDDSLMVLSNDGKTRPKLVHRLDRATSGVILVARNDYAAAKLTEAFRDRATRKVYWAVTRGVPGLAHDIIDAPLIKYGEVMKIADYPPPDGAKSAVTIYKVVETVGETLAFVVLWPVTGRTHQLRVHLAHIGTPILGDELYGGDERAGVPSSGIGAGLHLHARRIVIPHPRRGVIDVSAPLGKAMLKTWRFFHFDENANVELPE